MFMIDPKIDEKDLKEKNLFKALVSMNSHQVATPETSLEDARSYVFFFREEKNRLSAYIGLHLLLTDRKLIYANSANPFSEDELLDVEDEARDFAEYLGAMMDEVDLANMSDLELESWIEAQGIFGTKTQTETVPVEQPPVPEVAVPTPLQVPPAAMVQPEPVPEVVAHDPAPQQPVAPVQPAPATEVKSAPETTVAPVKPAPETYPAEVEERPSKAPMTETVQQDVQVQAPPPAATKRRREPVQKEAATVIEISPKQPVKKMSFSATGVVSRDREALARLLTSF